MTKEHSRKAGDGGKDAAADGGSGWRADPRFGHLATDPRYRSAATRKATRMPIDARFKAMFTDPDFTTDARSDKRGRPVAMSSRQDLRRFYGLKEEEEEEKREAVQDEGRSEDDEVAEEADDSDEHDEEAKVDEGEETDDGDSEDDEEYDTDEEEDAEAKESPSSEDEEFSALQRSAAADSDDGASDADIVATSRLAVTQQDWEQLKVTDLYMLLSSHCPAAQGRLLSVTVYPSKFGLRRLAAEAASGPLELVAAAAAAGKKPSTRTAAEHSRRLRRHQLKRLWYYYAVAEFDSVPAAAAVYEQCAGLEIESAGGCLRLSYVPDGMQFGGEDDVPAEWRHLVSRCSGLDPAAYKPCKFVTASLGRTRVGLTWDETPAERTRYLQGLFAKPEFDEADPDLGRLSEFLAMSSDEDSEDDQSAAATGGQPTKRRDSESIRKLRAALLGDGAADAAKNETVAAFSDDELPDDIAAVHNSGAAAAAAAPSSSVPAEESRKRSRRRRLKAQAKRAKLAKAGLLPAKAGSSDSSEDDDDNEDATRDSRGRGRKVGETLSASEQELALLVADRSASAGAATKGRVTAADVASDERFGALFTDTSFHIDPTHSEAAKAAEVQRLIVGAKKRAAIGLDT